MPLFRSRIASCLAAVSLGATALASGVTETADAARWKPGPDCGDTALAKPGGGWYSCTFADDFSGRTLSSSNWSPMLTAATGNTGGGATCLVNDPDNLSVRNGALRMTTLIETKPFTCKSPYGDFVTDRTGGGVTSFNKFSQAYGRFEFRAMFPATTEVGQHTALWMYPTKNTYGGWPHSGEIDVAEWWSGNSPRVYPSLHYPGSSRLVDTGHQCWVAMAGGAWHTYALEWDRTEMRFIYDGQLCFSRAWAPAAPLEAPQPFDQPFFLIMNQVFGGGLNAVTDKTLVPATTYVDWVRVWK